MANKLLVITIQGNRYDWSFQFYGDPKYIPEWEKDGLHIYEVVNTIPAWVPSRFIKLWCKLQDWFNFKYD